MSFGGGGSAKTIAPSQEYQKILNIFQRQALPAFKDWRGNEPLLNQQTGLAEANAGALPGYLKSLQDAYTSGNAQIPGLQRTLSSAYGSALPSSTLRGILGSAYNSAVPTGELTKPLMATYGGYLNDIVKSGGALTPQLNREATQAALGIQARQGMDRTNAGLASALLNRDSYRQNRYSTALGQMLGIGQSVEGIDNAAMQRALGYQGALSGIDTTALQRAQGYAGSQYALGQAPFQNALALAQGRQGLSAEAQRQLYGAEAGPISAYGSLLNPVGTNVSDVIGYNLNAQNAANTASANKTGSTIGGIGSAAGGILGGLAMSDERLKTNITDTGERTPEGIPIKTFEYTIKPGERYRGVIAQDVEKVLPDSVVTVMGIKFVRGFTPTREKENA